MLAGGVFRVALALGGFGYCGLGDFLIFAGVCVRIGVGII